MNELEAAIERLEKFKNGPRNELSNEETKISLLSFIEFKILAENLRKIIGDTEFDEAELYRNIEKLTREEMEKNRFFEI